MKAIRAVDIDKGIIEGIAIPFDGPWNGKDAFGTVFTRDTNYYLDWFNRGRPILYAHGENRYFGGTSLGRDIDTEMRDDGLWIQAELEKSDDYWQRIVPLLNKEALYFSSGAAPALVRSTDEGVMTDWAWIETSLTPEPANPYAVLSPKRKAEALRCMGGDMHKYIQAQLNLDGIEISTDIGGGPMGDMIIAKIAKMVYEQMDAGDITPPEDDGMRSADPIQDLFLETMKIRSG